MDSLDGIIDRAKRHLAQTGHVPQEKVALKQVEAVSWPDTSIGSPRAGRAYAQVVTPGYRLVLSDGFSDFEYHTDGKGRVVLHRVIDRAGRITEGGVP
ncbi:MAG: hypothetical protein KJ624_08395 [Chloroflexi bacterium]|nr:hypothetical protein [Chloroflexota bacterium]